MPTPDEPGKGLATFNPSESAFPVLFSQDGEGSIAQVIEDNFGDEGFSPSDLDRLTIPSGGGTSWEVPDEDPVRAIEGVIVHRQQTRSMWFKKRGEDGEDDGPPDCYSPDGKHGIGVMGPGSESNPSGECITCPFNVFGTSTSGSGNGKACKEQMQVFMLREDAVLPIQLSLPPTSLKPFRKHMTRLATKGKSYYAVVTRFALKVEKGGGQTYSVIEPSTVLQLAPEEVAAARAYGHTMKTYLEQAAAARAAADASEHNAAATAGGSADPDGVDASTGAPAGKG